ncbi:flagellar hook-basal body complex protein FliE [Amorphus orientalis]|nr:flagellar hook-basal body complex protein FliE [Amorphus orientalis]
MINSIGAVGSVASEIRPQGAGAAASGASPTEFGDVLAQMSSNAVNTLKTGEAAALSGIEGNTSVQKVVEAIMSAEQTLQAAIAIRDKVVNAYQEVSRMAI